MHCFIINSSKEAVILVSWKIRWLPHKEAIPGLLGHALLFQRGIFLKIGGKDNWICRPSPSLVLQFKQSIFPIFQLCSHLEDLCPLHLSYKGSEGTPIPPPGRVYCHTQQCIVSRLYCTVYSVYTF